MDWNRSQRALMKLARESFSGCSLAVVQVEDWGSGLTSVLRHIERQPGAGDSPRSVVLDGLSQWDCVRSLAKKAALPGHGCGYFDIIHDAMMVLSKDRKRPIIAWLEEARMMRPSERETIFAHFAYAAEHMDFDIRVAFVIGKVSIWCKKDQIRKPGFPALGNRLLHRATVVRFGKTAFEEVEDPSELDIARDPYIEARQIVSA